MRAGLASLLATLTGIYACTGADPVFVGNGGDSGPAPSDARTADDGAPDRSGGEAGDVTDGGARRCDPAKPFAPATEVAGLPEGHNLVPRLSDDELTVYYSWHPPGGTARIYRAERTSLGDPFTDQTELGFPPFADGGSFYHPTFLASQLTMIVSAGTVPTRDLYIATRGAAGVTTFGSVTTIDDASATVGDELAPYLTRSAKALYFVRGVGGVTRIHRAARSGASYGPAEEVLGIAPDVQFPVVHDDELTIYFSRLVGARYEIVVASRPGIEAPFGEPRAVFPDEGPQALDLPTWISPDDCALYFRTQRQNDGVDHAMVARRPP